MTPNPGSTEARELGCLCPIMDNNYGAGRGDGHFYINGACPVHGDKIDIQPVKEEKE